MTIQGYYLGLPVWGFKEWAGSLYRRDAKPREFLGEYARVFNAVEGNTTFYSVPPPESVARWRDAVPASFRFCLKLPREITHRKGLEEAGGETAEFLARVAPLGERLGPFMIQLPPSFGPDRLEILDRYLATLPEDLRFAVELRHPAFFAPEARQRLDELLERRGCDRVILDTRGLRAGDPQHPDLAAARHPKPDLPVRAEALGRHPFLRFIAHPEMTVNLPWLERWSEHLARWIRQGRRPVVIVHCPNDLHSPRLARRLHRLLAARLELVGEMPEWPGERGEDAGGQLSLL